MYITSHFQPFHNTLCVPRLKLVGVCCRKGSIVSEYNIFFIDNSTIVAEELDDTLKKYLEAKGCKKNGADCQIGDLVGVDKMRSEAGGI